MKNAQLVTVFTVTACLAASPLFAKDKAAKPPGHNKADKTSSAQTVAASPGKPESEARNSAKEPWISAKVTLSDNERQVIHGYVRSYPAQHHSGRKPKQLPPGLAKKVARGEQLPPGWQKKCVVGQVMPVEVYEKVHPLPPDLVIKLPPPPPDTVTITIGGKVVRLAKATREILDVFDVHVRL